MTLMSENLSPSLLMVEQGSTPATPSAGDQKLFIRTSDHLLCYVDSSGTVTPVGGAGSGSITASGYTQTTAKMLGRSTASTGAIEEITVGSGLSLSAGSLTATGGGGTDVVNVASGAGSVTIPGLKSLPDAVPGSPSAYDDEFDTTSTLSSTLGTLDSNTVSDALSNLHLKKTATGGQAVFGAYKTAPSFPFTVTAKLSDFLPSAAYQMYGIILGVTSPGGFMVFGLTYPGTGWYIDPEYSVWASNTSRSSVSTYTSGPVWPRYLRIVATSTSNLAVAISHQGYVWRTLASSLNPGITITTVGLIVGSATNSVTADAYFDWIRFT